MNKTLLLLPFLTGLGFSLTAQNVTIPDANFKAYLVGNAAINTNMDAEIQVSEASSFTGAIDCNTLTIADLTGIEAFTLLTDLTCSSNQLTSLDVSSNTSLTNLNCFYNQLTSLDLSLNTNLTFLTCSDNVLTNLDVSANTALTYLQCANNQLTSLDLSLNTNLTSFNCYHNQLTNLDVSTNTALDYLNCQTNQLSTLDVSNNTVLTTLNCMFNNLTTLTTSNSINTLQCTDNLLTALDLSGNAGLTVLTSGDNQLTSLNVKNGNNLNMNTVLFYTANNPSLTCIEVDDAAYSTANWTYIDAIVTFSENCLGGLDTQQENSMKIALYPNPTSSNLIIETEELIQTVSIFSITGVLEQQETTKSFSVEALPAGIYIVNVTTEQGIQSARFVKE